jgi:hypothetical protein
MLMGGKYSRRESFQWEVGVEVGKGPGFKGGCQQGGKRHGLPCRINHLLLWGSFAPLLQPSFTKCYTASPLLGPMSSNSSIFPLLACPGTQLTPKAEEA